MTGEKSPANSADFLQCKHLDSTFLAQSSLAEKFQLSIFLNVHPFALREETHTDTSNEMMRPFDVIAAP